jgi:hypothetical protein
MTTFVISVIGKAVRAEKGDECPGSYYKVSIRDVHRDVSTGGAVGRCLNHTPKAAPIRWL